MTAGTDWSRGMSNIDVGTGIRYGAISQRSISPDALDEMDSVWPDASCPLCGNEVIGYDDDAHSSYRGGTKHAMADYACEICRFIWSNDAVYPEEPIGLYYEGEGYQVTDCLDNDLLVMCSPYYTLCAFCSPCVPGAGNLDAPCTDGVKTYCLGPDWFEEYSAPYPVWRVSDNQKIA